MKTLGKLFLFAPLFAFLLLSCSSSKEEEPEDVLLKIGDFPISELAGNWEVTKAQFSVNTVSVDVVQDGGTAGMTVQSNGRFTLTLDPIDRAAYTMSGEMFWEKWEGTFYFAIVWDAYPEDWDTYGHTWDGTTFTINGGSDTGEYDFDNDGDAEPCTLHFIFVRP